MGNEIANGSKVKAHLRITLSDGTVAESTFESTPLVWILGQGDLHPNLEKLFLGLGKGDKRTVDLPAELGFGVPRLDLVQELPRSQFSPDMPPEKGQVIEFSTPDGTALAGTVLGVDGKNVTMDFNAPLAGRDLHIEIEVLEVDPNT